MSPRLGMKRRRARLANALMAGGLIAVAAGLASGADAVVVANTCDAFALDAAGVPGATPLAENVPLDANVPPLDGPSQVFEGTLFDVTGTPVNTVIPAQLDVMIGTLPVTVDVIETKNITLDIEITGAAGFGTPVFSGGNVLGATATIVSGNILRIVLPGSTTGSAFPVTGDAYFPGGSNFDSPEITLPITAGAAGTTILGSLVDFSIDARTLAFGSIITNSRQLCDPGPNNLGEVDVVAEPATTTTEEPPTTTAPTTTAPPTSAPPTTAPPTTAPTTTAPTTTVPPTTAPTTTPPTAPPTTVPPTTAPPTTPAPTTTVAVLGTTTTKPATSTTLAAAGTTTTTKAATATTAGSQTQATSTGSGTSGGTVTLPRTGSSMSIPLLVVGLALFGVGAVMTFARRRALR